MKHATTNYFISWVTSWSRQQISYASVSFHRQHLGPLPQVTTELHIILDHVQFTLTQASTNFLFAFFITFLDAFPSFTKYSLSSSVLAFYVS